MNQFCGPVCSSEEITEAPAFVPGIEGQTSDREGGAGLRVEKPAQDAHPRYSFFLIELMMNLPEQERKTKNYLSRPTAR